jgi:hypothetical protein
MYNTIDKVSHKPRLLQPSSTVYLQGILWQFKFNTAQFAKFMPFATSVWQ